MARRLDPHASPWLKRVLIPLWIIQIFFVGVLLFGAIFDLVEGEHIAPYFLLVLVFCILALLLNLTEIILFIRHTLTPLTLLILQIVTTAAWLLVFIVVMVKAVNADPSDSNQKLTTTNTYVLVGAIWAAAVDLSHLATVIYAGIIYHRHRISTRTALFQSLSIQNRSNTQQCYEEGSGVATADHQASLSPSARTYTEGGLLSPLAEQESYAAIGLLEGQSRNGIGPVESGGSAASPLEHGSHGAGPFETDGLAVRGAMQEIPPEGAERYEMAAYEDVPGSKLRWEKH